MAEPDQFQSDPFPLYQLDSKNIHLLDKDTMKKMVSKMSQTLQDFKKVKLQDSSLGFFKKDDGISVAQIDNEGRQTAKEFFSKENMKHPVVEENLYLRQRLKQLEEAKQMGGAVSISNVSQEKTKMDQEFQQYKTMVQQEVKKLKKISQDLEVSISETKSEMQSQRPVSSYSQSQFEVGTKENDEFRRQLADKSVELEELKEQHKKLLAKQEKDIEESYSELGTYAQEEKQLRVKVNQLENDLEMQFKRLDIIAKSKGLSRPQRPKVIAEQNSGTRGRAAGQSYVSPYRQGSSGNRGQTDIQKKFSPFRNNYTPPNKRVGYSPSGFSNGSGGQRGTGLNTKYSGNKFTNYSPKDTALRRSGGSFNGSNRQPSPGNKSNQSNNSKKSANSQNRLYSPSGRIRNENYMGYNKAGINRVRREPAVGGSSMANSRSNSRTRGIGQENNQMSKQRITQPRKVFQTQSSNTISQNNMKGTSNIIKTQNHIAPSSKPSLFGQSSTTANAKGDTGNIDQKIEKLQSLLQIAKSGQN